MVEVTAKRDYLMDNLKALMLFLVAFGHTLDVYIGAGSIELYLMKYVYLFHMPMFAFITGFFTKNLEKARNSAIEKCLVPYLVFQSVYVLMANVMIRLGLASFNSSVFNGSLLVPSSAFYYLLAVFVWKLIAKDYLRLRSPLLISVILGLLVSITDYDEFHVGYGAVFSLLPFFVLGVMCDHDIIRRIKRIPVVIAIGIMAIGIIPAVFLPYGIHSIRMTYSAAGFSNIQGILYRIVFYTIAILMGVALIRLMSERKLFFSHVGKASILVYAGSTFLAPHTYVLLDKVFALSSNKYVNMIGMVTFCLTVVFLCSIPIFQKWYSLIMSGLNSCFFKKEEKNSE